MTWRWKTMRNPWPGPERIPHPLADRFGQEVRVIARGRPGCVRNVLLEFPDGFRTVAPRWAAT